MRIVQKFGGSSLADWTCLRRAAGLCLEARRRGQQPILVVSAAGDSTDEMIEEVRKINPHPPAREMDALLATGEQRSAALMAIALARFGAPARSFSGWQAGLITEEKAGGARLRAAAPERLLEALEAGQIPVVAGFQGLTPGGDISTLGRGGSDTTAVALAIALDAGRCEIYTDVDGIYTADPRLVPGARYLREVDMGDMLSLAEAGSQVLHAESLRLAAAHGQPIWLLSSFTASPGTLVHPFPPERRPPFSGMTRDNETHRVTLVGHAAPELRAKAEALLAESGIPVRQSESGGNFLRLTVDAGREVDALRRLHSAVFEG